MNIKLFFSALAFVLFANANAQQFPGLDASPHDVTSYRIDRQSPVLIRVEYGRPQMKGRTIFGDLVPFGKVWRTGANEATEITFNQDMMFGGKKVIAGTYTLYTIPNEKSWTIILNSATNQWGAYQYNEAEDVVRVVAPVKQLNESLEAFSIVFQKSQMHLAWDNTLISIDLDNNP